MNRSLEGRLDKLEQGSGRPAYILTVAFDKAEADALARKALDEGRVHRRGGPIHMTVITGVERARTCA